MRQDVTARNRIRCAGRRTGVPSLSSDAPGNPTKRTGRNDLRARRKYCPLRKSSPVGRLGLEPRTGGL
jgi:hypothetical protein